MSAMVPLEAFAIQKRAQQFEKDLVDLSLDQLPLVHAAQAAYDAAAYYEQLALMLEAESLAFTMAWCSPCQLQGEKDECVPQAPPGLESVAPPPGLEPPSMCESSLHLAKNTQETKTRQICWFQNRYHHSKPEDKVSPCSRGDDCLFCHTFHPKMSRREGPKSRCSCASHFQHRQEHLQASDTESTGLDDESSLDPSCSDESTEMLPSAESLPLPPPPLSPELRQICYFQNRWYNSEDGDSYKPCSKGDNCVHCHEVHPKIKRRTDRTSKCDCPRGIIEKLGI